MHLAHNALHLPVLGTGPFLIGLAILIVLLAIATFKGKR